MKFSSKDFRVREGDEVDLRRWPTTVEPVYESKEHYHKLLGEHVAQLSSLQQLLYASNRYAVLLIFPTGSTRPAPCIRPALVHGAEMPDEGAGQRRGD